MPKFKVSLIGFEDPWVEFVTKVVRRMKGIEVIQAARMSEADLLIINGDHKVDFSSQDQGKTWVAFVSGDMRTMVNRSLDAVEEGAAWACAIPQSPGEIKDTFGSLQKIFGQ